MIRVKGLMIIFDIISWRDTKTRRVNHSWMSSVNTGGYGPIREEDFTKLMTSLGFCVKQSKTTKYQYKFDKTYLRNFEQTLFDPTDSTAFPELEGEDRHRFFSEFFTRINESCELVSFQCNVKRTKNNLF